MKITTLRLANSVKAGPQELNFLTAKTHDMELVDAVRIKITYTGSGADKYRPIYTSLFNAIFWQDDEEPETVEAPAKRGPGRPKGG